MMMVAQASIIRARERNINDICNLRNRAGALLRLNRAAWAMFVLDAATMTAQKTGPLEPIPQEDSR